jgi:hypothetical protein
MLFNIVADILVVILERVKSGGQIKGVTPHLVDGDYPFFNMLTIQFSLWNMTLKKQGT